MVQNQPVILLVTVTMIFIKINSIKYCQITLHIKSFINIREEFPFYECISESSSFIDLTAVVFHPSFLFQVIAQITSSLDGRMCHLQLQHLHCGTTTCVLSIQVLWEMEQLSTCRAHQYCHLADISLFKLKLVLKRLTSVRSKSTLYVRYKLSFTVNVSIDN